jgi:hypothetical protein
MASELASDQLARVVMIAVIPLQRNDHRRVDRLDPNLTLRNERLCEYKLRNK